MTTEACVAEARAPVGSHVVLARFEVLRFDPDFAQREGRTAFLRRVVREISRPVMPQDEAFEYLPTQAVQPRIRRHWLGEAQKPYGKDADFAQESANLTRAQILVQSGTNVLALANQNPQNVLALLR